MGTHFENSCLILPKELILHKDSYVRKFPDMQPVMKQTEESKTTRKKQKWAE